MQKFCEGMSVQELIIWFSTLGAVWCYLLYTYQYWFQISPIAHLTAMHLLNFVLMIWWIPKSSHDLGYDLYFPGNVWGHTCGLAICDVLLEQVETKVLPLPPSLLGVCVWGCHMFSFFMLFVLYIFFVNVSLCIWSSTHLSGTIF